MPLKTIRSLWILLIPIFVSLACNLGRTIERVDETKETAESLATQVQEGRNFLETAQAIATDFGGGALIQTAQALATDVGESGFLETAQAFATEQGPSLIATAQTFATEEGPVLQATAQAIATKAATVLGAEPPDIPVIEDDQENFVGSSEIVSYMTSADYAQVVDFYKVQMPAMGWVTVEEGWFESNNLAVLNYEKPERLAAVTITPNPLEAKTIVLVTIQPK